MKGSALVNMGIKQAEECNQESGEDETVETERERDKDEMSEKRKIGEQ